MPGGLADRVADARSSAAFGRKAGVARQHESQRGDHQRNQGQIRHRVAPAERVYESLHDWREQHPSHSRRPYPHTHNQRPPGWIDHPHHRGYS